QRPAAQLVEDMRADADGEKEGGEGQPQPPRAPLGRERGSDYHIAQVPERVRRVEERDVVAPAAARERVERRPCSRTHVSTCFRPQITMAPPTPRRRCRTSSMPA